MNKIIHIKMDLYINHDALKIHEYNEDISIIEIKNELSKLIGWNSFIELEKSVINLKSKGVFGSLNIFGKNIKNIEDLSSNELNQITIRYFEKIKELYPCPKKYYYNAFNGERHEPYDIYKILDGLLYNHENTKKTLIKEGTNEIIEISTLSNDTLIEIGNEMFEDMTHFLLDILHSNDNAGSSMWKGRTAVYLNLIFEIFKTKKLKKWQFEFTKYFSFESIVREWIDCDDEKLKSKIYSVIVNMPTFPSDGNFYGEDNSFGRIKTEELYGYMIMSFWIFNKPICLNLRDNVKAIYNFNELKQTNKTIVLKHYNNEDNNYIIQLLKVFLDNDPNAKNNHISYLMEQ